MNVSSPLSVISLCIILATLCICFSVIYRLLKTPSPQTETRDNFMATGVVTGTFSDTRADISSTGHFSRYLQVGKCFNFSRFSRERWLRLCTALFGALTIVFRGLASLFISDGSHLAPDLSEKICVIFYIVFLWCSLSCYCLTLLERLARIEIIARGTLGYVFLRLTEFIIIIGSFTVIVAEIVDKVFWIYSLDSRDFKSPFRWYQLFLSSAMILLEISINIRFLHTIIKDKPNSSKLSSPSSSHSGITLRTRMIIYYSCLLLFDCLILSAYSYTAQRYEPSDGDAIINIIACAAVLHYFISFYLMDLLVLQLTSNKR